MNQEVETLHRPFIKFLRDHKLPYIRARSDRKSTISLGAHDFTVFCGRFTLAIEFKLKGKELDPDQMAWREAMRAVDAEVYVLRSIEDAVELVRVWREKIPQPPAEYDTGTTVIWKGASLRQLSDGAFERIKQ